MIRLSRLSQWVPSVCGGRALQGFFAVVGLHKILYSGASIGLHERVERICLVLDAAYWGSNFTRPVLCGL
jgi:hypothetical protein